MRIQVVLTLPREAVSVPLARHTVSAALQSAGIADDCLAEVEVALSEACTNVFHHAGAGDSYEVAISIGDEQLTMEVVDSGAGFAWRATESAMPHELAEGGRGLALMSAFSDHALFDTVSGDGGSVQLMKRLRWADGAPLQGATTNNKARLRPVREAEDGS